MGRIVISEFIDERAVAALHDAGHDVYCDATLVDDAPRLVAEAVRADALIIRNRTQLRGELLAQATRLRVVGRLGVGLDNIDVAACEARGIRVIPATGANARSVAEYVIAAAMLLLRGAYRATAEVAAGAWPRPSLIHGREVGGKTMGLVGFGAIGQLTAALARGVGMQVLAHDAMLPPDHAAFSTDGARRCATLDELCAASDVVSLHVPLLESTHRLFDAARIATMKPGAILINSARGGVLDEAAVAAALKSGRLGGAALDVFETEPLPAGSVLADCPNLLLTPHIAGVSIESNERVSALIAQRVLEALR
ncbi:MAG TPA: hydroxyacid dehydrogenase [Burkholderiaceae bacterium]|nr:hydroxyacid dehydrogenase [Burkholderiaceae bacterium]